MLHKTNACFLILQNNHQSSKLSIIEIFNMVFNNFDYG